MWTSCLLVGLLAAIVGGCSRSKPNTKEGAAAVLRVSQRNEPGDLDPATASLPDDYFIIRALSEGLLVPSAAGGEPAPGLAERYDVSANQLIYTFRLRADLRWSNGEPLTAEDLVASFRRTLTPATAAPKASLFFAVKNARAFATGALADFSAVGFHAPNPRTVVVTLSRPIANFPRYAASDAWIPVNPRIVARYGRAWTEPAHYVGNGPFTLAEWRPQQRILVRKNPHYHDAASVKLDAIEFLRFDSGETEDRAFRAGQLDVTMAVPPTKLATYARERPQDLHRLPLAETRFLSFNVQHLPLDDVRVRRALSAAIDRRGLIDHVLHGGQQPADRFLAPALRNKDSAALPQVRADRTDARRLLAEAGFPGGRGFPKLEVTAWSQSQVSTLEAVQAMWRQELGIDIAISVREARVHLAALSSGNYDIAFVTTILDVADPVSVLDDFTTGAPNNFPHWQSAAFDELMATAAAQPDAVAQAPLLARAETLLLEAAPVAPLYFNAQNWLMSPRVRGWQQDALWTRRYVDVSLDDE